MPNFLQWLAGNAQFLLFIFVFIIPVLGAALRWVETQRERRRRQAELERRRLEALRTGRFESAQTAAPGPAPVRTVPSREEIAARRQREMQERLRQRLEQQRRAGGQPTTTSIPGGVVPPSRRPTPVGRPTSPAGRHSTQTAPPTTTRQAPPPARPFPQQQRTRSQEQPQQTRAPRPSLQGIRPQQVRLSPSLQPASGDGVAREEIGSAREAASLQTVGPVVRIGPGLSIQRLREAVVLREVLDRPLALREPDSDLFA
jgi:hypothetical protein